MRISKFIIFLIIPLFLFTSCSSNNQGASSLKKIVVWHWMNDRHSAFQKLAVQYKQETGIEVEFKLFSPPDIYSQKVIAAARAGNLPDVFGILGEKNTMASFIKAGYILDITPYMEENNGEWRDSFYPQSLAVNIFEEGNSYNAKPGVYGVPIDTTVMGMIYNKKILSKAGFSVAPATFDEFISMAKAVKEKNGVNGFVCGWGESWLLNCLATEWAINIMGEDKFIKTIKGDVPYTDVQWLEVLNLFSRLKDSGMLAPNITTMINKEAEDSFSKEAAAFSFNGSWTVNVYKQLNSDLDYTFFPLPKASGNFDVKTWGGAGSSFMAKAKSPIKNETVAFLKWMTAPSQQKFLIKETNNLPAIKGCEDELPDILKSLLPALGSLTHPNVWPVNEDSRVLEVMNQGLQQITMGIKSACDVAKEIQEVKMRVNSR